MGARPAKGKRGRPRKLDSALSGWVDRANLTREEFAALLGITRQYVDHLCRGERRPGLELALAIERVTGGAVPAASWLKVPPHSRD